MRFSLFASALLCSAASVTLAPPSAAQTLQATLYQSGFSQPVFLCSPPGDLARQFVVEQTGRIRIIKNGATLATPFLHLGSAATGGLGKISTGSERGLLGLAFHPNYAANGRFYVNYTNISGSTVIAQYQVSSNPDVAGTTELPLLTIAQPQSNHNGGCIQFGADGMLYIGMGDGGNANDTGTGHATIGNGQSPSTLLGKILRIDVDLPAPYVPASNPYFGAGDPLDEIWHMGVRNPFRFSFDRANGDLYIGDVGQDAVEEVSFAPAGVSGLNFGWKCMEGTSCTGLGGCTCNAPALTPPIKDYPQSPGGHCSVIGGYVYRGTNVCGLQGTYFYADYCSSAIWTFQYTAGGSVTNHTTRTTELEPAGTPTIGSISSFGEDAQGELYVCDYSDGEIYRIDPAGGAADCNANGIADGCDLQSGFSLDCNGNQIPDECDLASGAALDCNANNVPDSCDISAGTSQDINSNGIPDECECAGGAPPVVYCTAKLNSQFCMPSIGYSGAPSLSNGNFHVTATLVLNNKSGLLFYGSLPHNAPFQGGTMCVRPPVHRTPTANSGGNPTGTSCTGNYNFDFSAWINLGFDPALQVVGHQVNAQFWSRDPQDPFTTSLTDAVQFFICQ
ncbi:MAG: PQQ-dependent sugar dehydrogenase [Planctomycetes bacterium]|nr:PQQ-dependent sugar dehydrogenase [Planctomycetota bacterium]